MAIDQMSLRPVAISRPPQPSTPWTTVPAAAAVIVSPAGDQGAGKKVKFLCSFGGRIIPRPSDGALRYVGGHTRIISVQKDASFAEFAAKMAEALGESSAVFKYQLPGEDLDALVSVSCSEDLVNMMEEYDKLAGTVPDGSAKIRAFLFSPAELAAAAIDYPMRTGGGMESTGRMYFEAVNGVAAADGIDGLQRKESSGSASSSTQNLQGTIIGEATNGVVSECTVSGLLTNAIDSPHNATRFVYLDRNNAPAIPVAGMVSPESNISSLARQEGIPATHFAPAYIEPVRIQNMNPTQMGVAGGTQTVNLVPFTVHHYMPTGADNSVALHASQADNLNSAQPRLELKQEDPYGGKFSQQHPGDRNLKPLSQLPPLPPSSVQPPDADRYCLSEVSHIQQPQLLRMADCLMCQKALPHAHSDTLIQDYAISSIGNHTEVPPMFYSFRSQDIDKEQFCQFDAEVSGQDLSYQNSKNVVSRGQLADYMCHQINEAQKYTNGDPISQKVENLNRVDMQYLAAEASGGASFSNHMHCHLEDSSQFQQQKQQQLLQMFQHQNYPFEREIVDTPHPGHDLKERQQWQTLQPSQYVVKQGSVVNPADKSTVRNSDFAVVEPVALDYMNFPDHQYIRSFTDRVNMLHLSPLETSEYQGKPLGYPPGIPVSVKHDDSVLMVGNSYNGPSYKENTPFFGNAVVNPGFLPNVNYMMPNEQFPPTKHNVESLISNRGAAVMRSNGPFPSNLGIGTGTGYPVSYENSLRSPRVSCGIVSEVTSDRRNGASHIQSREILDRFSVPPNDDSPFQLPHAPGLSGCVKTFSEQLPSDSLFYDQDLHSNPDNTHVFPPRPNIVDDNDVVAPKNSCISNHIGVSIGSNVVSLLEEGNLQHPTEYLINDSKSEAVQLRKEEDHIKQQLQAVAEDVAASVLQPNVTGFASDTEEFASELNYKREIIEENDDFEKAAHDENSEDAKIRNLDKLHHGFQLTDDIGHLQIIKNCDLEELRELGSGAFGIVYHGKWRGTDVAIKRINERCFTGKQSEQERMRTDFWNEACKLAELHHPNVVAFYGIVLDGPEGSVATVTEYMANGSLRQVLLRNDRSLDCRKRLLIAMDVAFGMEYLHAKNIVHFDLKSDNLLVNLRDPQRPICKVSDLGLSKVKCKTLISGGMRGTLPWMAPELLCGNDSLVSEKVDVYSFGVVLWELLTGEEPYADLHYGAIIGGILSNSLRPPIPKSCDAEWGMLMEQCWSAEPSDRPSFTEIADRLRLMAAAQPHKGHGQAQK